MNAAIKIISPFSTIEMVLMGRSNIFPRQAQLIFWSLLTALITPNRLTLIMVNVIRFVMTGLK